MSDCPECARRAAEDAAKRARHDRIEWVWTNAMAVAFIGVGLWQLAQGRWKDPTIVFGGMFATVYLIGAVVGLVRFWRRRKRADVTVGD